VGGFIGRSSYHARHFLTQIVIQRQMAAFDLHKGSRQNSDCGQAGGRQHPVAVHGGDPWPSGVSDIRDGKPRFFGLGQFPEFGTEIVGQRPVKCRLLFRIDTVP
jgi:hypothetical protein